MYIIYSATNALRTSAERLTLQQHHVFSCCCVERNRSFFERCAEDATIFDESLRWCWSILLNCKAAGVRDELIMRLNAALPDTAAPDGSLWVDEYSAWLLGVALLSCVERIEKLTTDSRNTPCSYVIDAISAELLFEATGFIDPADEVVSGPHERQFLESGMLANEISFQKQDLEDLLSSPDLGIAQLYERAKSNALRLK